MTLSPPCLQQGESFLVEPIPLARTGATTGAIEECAIAFWRLRCGPRHRSFVDPERSGSVVFKLRLTSAPSGCTRFQGERPARRRLFARHLSSVEHEQVAVELFSDLDARVCERASKGTGQQLHGVARDRDDIVPAHSPRVATG